MWKRLKRQLWQWRIPILIAPSIAGAVLLLRFTGLLQTFEWAAFDQWVQWRPQEPLDDRILVVEITEADIQKIGQWPMPDAKLVQLLERLRQPKPRAIGLDLYRDLPVEPGYASLVKLFETTPNLIGIKKVVGDSKSGILAAPPVLGKLNQVAANDVVVDADSKIRRGLLYIEDKSGNNVFSLGLMLALIYLQDQNVQLEVVDNRTLKLGRTLLPAFAANDGGYVRAEDGGYQILMNYRGNQHHFHTVSMTDVLENRVPADQIRDRLVLVGTSAESVKDFFYSPYSQHFYKMPEQMSGVYIHANLASQILSTVLDQRSSIQVWAKPWEWLWIFAWAGIGTSISWALRYPGSQSKRTLNRVVRGFSLFLASGSLVAITYAAFLAGWWIPVIPPLLAVLGGPLGISIYLARSAGEIRKTFGRYLTEEVVSSLLETPGGLKFGGERRKVTILMSDIRGFSAISERFPPERVVSFLNIYLEAMADVITSYGGTIDEFIGDAILVIFGAPTQRPDDSRRAIACAIAMQLAMDQVNQQIQSPDLPRLEMGIGIHTGEVVVGNIGSIKRAKYGVVGSQVNLTGRIESYTVGGQILISEATLHDAGSILRIDGEMQVQPKGFQSPITLYQVGAIQGTYQLALPQPIQVLHTLEQALPIQYTVLDGKHVKSNWQSGTIHRLAIPLAEIHSDEAIAVLQNLKIRLLPEMYPDSFASEIYAKVIEHPGLEANHFCIYFTAIPPEIEVMFSHLVSQQMILSGR